MLTELPALIEMEVTMPTERKTKPLLESSDLDLVVLDEVLLAQSRRIKYYQYKKAGSIDCTTDNSDVGLAALSNSCKFTSIPVAFWVHLSIMY